MSRIAWSGIALAVLAFDLAASLAAQAPAFDVAAIHQNKSAPPTAANPPYSNFPLGPGDVYIPNGGYFKALNQPLVVYVLFAYKVMGNQAQSLIDTLPKWAFTDRFDIEARAEGNPSKDQMRAMMRSLLADRFKLAVHTETRQLPVYAMVLAKPGSMGPGLRAHPAAWSCSTEAPKSGAAPKIPEIDGFPALCGGILGLPAKERGRVRLGASNVSMKLIIEALGQLGRLGRPVVDSTGLTGNFDFVLEFTPNLGPAAPQADASQPADPGTQFLDAVNEQLGIKFKSDKAPVEVLIADHLEHPSEN